MAVYGYTAFADHLNSLSLPYHSVSQRMVQCPLVDLKSLPDAKMQVLFSVLFFLLF